MDEEEEEEDIDSAYKEETTRIEEGVSDGDSQKNSSGNQIKNLKHDNKDMGK